MNLRRGRHRRLVLGLAHGAVSLAAALATVAAAVTGGAAAAAGAGATATSGPLPGAGAAVKAGAAQVPAAYLAEIEAWRAQRIADLRRHVVVDFNKAYNPPCAISTFAVCPLPPRQNRLPLQVAAGEKTYRGGHQD